MTFTRKMLHVGATALMLSTVASVTTFVTADAAYAERGGNGNGNGNGNGRSNRDRDRSERGNNGNGNGNGRGAIASELKWLNAANANQNALENASPNSRVGQLYIFQQNSIAADGLDDALDTLLAGELTNAEGEVLTGDDLAALSEDEIKALYGYSEVEGEEGYDTYLYLTARNADETVDNLLLEFTNGEGLSDEALAELERMLGLAEAVEE